MDINELKAYYMDCIKEEGYNPKIQEQDDSDPDPELDIEF